MHEEMPFFKTALQLLIESSNKISILFSIHSKLLSVSFDKINFVYGILYFSKYLFLIFTYIQCGYAICY